MSQSVRTGSEGRGSLPTDGYSLVEVLVVAVLSTGIIGGLYGTLRSATGTANKQVSIGEMQQVQRVAQAFLVESVHRAGRGLQAAVVPTMEMTVSVRNNVPAGALLVPGESDSPRLAAGSDVLITRGVLSSPIYITQSSTSPGSTSAGREAQIRPTLATLDVPRSVAGLEQDLAVLEEAILKARDGYPDAVLLSYPGGSDRYSVAEIDGDASEIAGQRVRLAVRFVGGRRTDRYRALGRGPVDPASVSAVGLLMEQRLFINEFEVVPGEKQFRLAMGLFYPGTQDSLLESPSNRLIPVAEDVVDLQAVLGIDTNVDGVVAVDEGDSSEDELLFNAPGDDPLDGERWIMDRHGRRKPVHYVRVTTVTRSHRAQPGYLAPPLPRVEDRTGPDLEWLNSVACRRHRRVSLSSLVAVRGGT